MHNPMPEPDISASFTDMDRPWPAAVMERHFIGLVLGVIAAAVLLPIMR